MPTTSTPVPARNDLLGRDDDLARLRPVLSPGGPSVTVLHGIGGIGKTSLLRALAFQHPETAFYFFDALDLPHDLSDLVRLASEGVVVVDGLEQSPSCEGVLRRKVAPLLPSSARLILASRSRPTLTWASDLGSRRFLSIELGGLTPLHARQLLARRGHEPVPTELLELCQGHPLMLVMAAQVPDLAAFLEFGLESAPEVLVAMVDAMSAIPSAEGLREAILVAAIARRTTEPLLRRVLGLQDAHALFEEIRRQSWTQIDRDGVFPHALVRDAQRAEAKWRDRVTYDRLFRSVADVALSAVREHGELALPDVSFLLADNTFYRRISSHRHGVVPGPITPSSDLEAVSRFFAPHFGRGHADRLLRLHAAGDLTFVQLHGPDGEPSEMISLLDQAVLFAQTSHNDPLVACAQRLIRGLRLRKNTQAMFSLGACNLLEGSASPLGNARILGAALKLALRADRLGATGSVVCPVELWRPMIERNPSISAHEEIEVDGQGLIVHVQDLRTLDVAGWLEMQLFPPPAGPPTEMEMLDRDEFGQAVRAALKCLARSPGELAATRLANTPMARRHTDFSSLLTETISQVSNLRCRRVLQQTYLGRPQKQYAVAIELGLSFATYRRALAQGVGVLTEALWEQEISI